MVQRLWSSVNVRKYRAPLRESVRMGPQSSVCIISSRSDDLLLRLGNGGLVSFPVVQTSHGGSTSLALNVKPDAISFCSMRDMSFQFRWPSRRCHSVVSLEALVAIHAVSCPSRKKNRSPSRSATIFVTPLASFIYACFLVNKTLWFLSTIFATDKRFVRRSGTYSAFASVISRFCLPFETVTFMSSLAVADVVAWFANLIPLSDFCVFANDLASLQRCDVHPLSRHHLIFDA